MDQDLLGNIPLFAKLSPPQLAELAGLLTEVRVRAHETVFWVGDRGSDFYLVQVGRCSVTCPDDKGKEMTLAEVEPGNFFGEISLLDGGPRTATVRAETDTLLLSLSRHDFLKFLESHPSAGVHIITTLGHRQRDMLEKLRGVANVNTVMRDRQTFGQRIADGFAAMMGSWPFIIVQSILLTLWVTVNVMALFGKWHWDEYPFILLNLALSFQAAYAAPIIMMSQNRQGEKDRIKADLDYQVNLKAQLEIMQLHQKLDRLTAALLGPPGAQPPATPPAATPPAGAGDGPTPHPTAPSVPRDGGGG